MPSRSPALFVDGGEGAGQGRDHDIEGAGPGHDDGLFVQRGEDVVGQSLGHAGRLGPDHFDESAASGFPQPSLSKWCEEGIPYDSLS